MPMRLNDCISIASKYDKMFQFTEDVPSLTQDPLRIKKNQPYAMPRKIKVIKSPAFSRQGYVRRKRKPKKLLKPSGFKKGEIVWAIWIEGDGTELKLSLIHI